MSHLNKLMVIGIRSFGPAEADKAVLDFDTPLTLIAGQNGAGKTTVIECLRFATTGDVPPNARGGAFVCDPRIAGKSIVKGVIRLKFKDTANNSVTCSRMLQSTQKSKKIEQKQLDGSMERVNARTKEKCKLTSRCGELDDEMVSHMGVSKAILNNVIFCHQEDSNWPLSEGKALKTRFDEIFASTRYSKALDSIKKVNLEQKTKMKEYTIEISYLQGSKKKADELKRRRKETQRQLDELKAKMAKIVEELQPKENRIQELDQLYEEFQTNQRKLAELKSSKNELEKLKQGLLEKLQVPLTESEDEIQSMLDRHSNRLERDRKDLAEQEESSHKLSADQDRLKSLHSDQSKEYGRLEVESKTADNFWGDYQRVFLDVKVFNPHAPSYRKTPLASVYHQQEKDKKRMYQERIREIEHGSFTPLVFSVSGGMGKEANNFFKRLATLLADKWVQPYALTINWLRCRISFSLLRAAIRSIRGARSTIGHPMGPFNHSLDLIKSESAFRHE